MHTKKLIKKPLVIGHRGAAGHQPENTLASVQAAIDLGAQMVEVDVHVVQGRLFVFHDHRLERLTGSPGKISSLTVDDLKKLRVQGHEIPSLEDVARLVRGRVSLNIEIKGKNCALPMVQAFRTMLAYGFQPEQILVSSYDHVQLHEMKMAEPRLLIGVLMECRPFDLTRSAKRLGAYSIHSGMNFATADYVKDAHKRGLKFFVYTVNHEEDVYELLEMGVDGIISDYPDMVRRILDQMDEGWAA